MTSWERSSRVGERSSKSLPPGPDGGFWRFVEEDEVNDAFEAGKL